MRKVLLSSMAGLAALTGGCAGIPGDLAAGPCVGQVAFTPASIRVFPLTSFDTQADGERVIVLHLELLDQYGDSVKGVGTLFIGAFVPASVTGATTIEDETWEVDLRSADESTRYYDPATLTYRVVLGNLTPAVNQVASGESPAGWIELQARFEVTDDQGRRNTLIDRYRLNGVR